MAILNDSLITNENVEKQELKNYWQQVFKKEADPRGTYDSMPINEVNYELDHPMTTNEVKSALDRMDPKTALGPNGMKLKDLRRVPIDQLLSLFLLFQATTSSP